MRSESGAWSLSENKDVKRYDRDARSCCGSEVFLGCELQMQPFLQYLGKILLFGQTPHFVIFFEEQEFQEISFNSCRFFQDASQWVA